MRLSDLKAGSGVKQTLPLPVTSPFPIEMTVVCGCRPGKTLVVTAGVHGCEYVGIETLNRLKRELEPAALSGRVILLPLVNPEGFYQGSKQTIPADGKNLNRMFPGKSDGTFSSRLARVLEETLYPEADFLMDLHGGCQRSTDSADLLSNSRFGSLVCRSLCSRRKPLRSLPGCLHLQKRTLQLGSPVRHPRPFSRTRRAGSVAWRRSFCMPGKCVRADAASGNPACGHGILLFSADRNPQSHLRGSSRGWLLVSRNV